MKIEILKRPRPLSGLAAHIGSVLAAITAAGVVGILPGQAEPFVNTLAGGRITSGGADWGYRDTPPPQFNFPAGLAVNTDGTKLFIADHTNNAIRTLTLGGNVAATFANSNQFVSRPVAVLLDSSGAVYALNKGNGSNGMILKFTAAGTLVRTNGGGLQNATAMAMDHSANFYVIVSNNTVMQISAAVTNVAGVITNAGTLLRGIVVMDSGLLALSDAGNHGIWLLNPANGVKTILTGFNGAGDVSDEAPYARLNKPDMMAKAGAGYLVFTDRGNHRVKVVDPVGKVTVLYGVSSNYWANHGDVTFRAGWHDGPGVETPNAGSLNYAESRDPYGVAVGPGGDVYTTETYYHLVRKTTGTGLPPPPPPPPPPPGAPVISTVTTNLGQVTLAWSAVSTATNYLVKWAPSSGGPYVTLTSVTGTSYTDSTVVNGATYYYVVSASNAGGEGPNSAERIATLPLPPVPDPQIGYVDFPAIASPAYTSVFHPVTSFEFFNDADIIIKGTPGSGTYYEIGYTTNTALVPNPTTDSPFIPPGYQDGLSLLGIIPYTVSQAAPFLTVKAFGAKGDGSPNSAVVQATFQFKTGNPNINGNNAAEFTITDFTTGAHLYYTLDGSDPSSTNANAVDLVPVSSNVWRISLAIETNTLFKVRAFRANYQPSAIVSNLFLMTNYAANKFTFGFAAGEGSSDFVASPGQLFYAPVTLSVLPAAKMYSFQFNVAVTNLDSAPAVPGEFRFQSMLTKPDPENPGYFLGIPPAMFVIYTTNIYFDGTTLVTNLIPNFTNLVFASQNLLGVGWLERRGETNLYDTTAQDLITYSQAHDTAFNSVDGKVIVGGYAFRVPDTSVADDQYRIRLGNPSATSDGVGAPGSSVFIDTPTNGSLTAGAINSIKHVTVGQRKYVAGDAAPFRWFNAGDFGNSNLLNDDVMQVFQSAIYRLNYPPAGSDFFDSMDSCCGTYVPQPGTDYLVPDGGSVVDQDALFTGGDTTINLIAFGDGQLDVCDIFVTFRRSLDPSLQWFQRFWTNGFSGSRVAQMYPNQVTAPTPLPPPASGPSPQVNFFAGDGVVTAGQTILVPISAHVRGNYPLRLLAMGLTVEPLDGSPAITTPVQFSPIPALGAPTLAASRGASTYSGAWLNNAIAGLTGDVMIGTLQVTLPANCPSNAAYAIVFDHASGSPNGLASFPSRMQSGLITLRDRSGSTLNDGISDSWRLRYFGTINNALSLPNADADGDGANNFQEYKAGTNPNDAGSVLRMQSKKGQSQTLSVRWPSVLNKQYVIERAASLYSAWTPVSTNHGTGWDMEYQDPTPGPGARFYRVRVAP